MSHHGQFPDKLVGYDQNTNKTRAGPLKILEMGFKKARVAHGNVFGMHLRFIADLQDDRVEGFCELSCIKCIKPVRTDTFCIILVYIGRPSMRVLFRRYFPLWNKRRSMGVSLSWAVLVILSDSRPKADLLVDSVTRMVEKEEKQRVK